MKGHKMMVGRCSGACVQEVLQCRKLQWGEEWCNRQQSSSHTAPCFCSHNTHTLHSVCCIPHYGHNTAPCIMYITLCSECAKKNHSLRKLHTVNYTKKYSTFCAVHVTLCIEQCSAVQCSIQCALQCSVVRSAVCSAVCSAVAPIVQKLMAALPTHPLPCLLNTGISMHHSLV